MRKWLLIPGIAVALVLAVAAWFAADDESEPRPPSDGNKAAATTPPWGHLVRKGSNEAQATPLGTWPFAAIKRGPPVPDALRRSVNQMLGEADELSLQFSNARFIRSADGLGMWVVPAKGVICLIRAANLAAACNTATQAYRRGITLQTYKHRNNQPTRFAAVGIVPNGINKVPVKIGRRWEKIEVVRNTLHIEAQKPIEIRLRLAKPAKP